VFEVYANYQFVGEDRKRLVRSVVDVFARGANDLDISGEYDDEKEKKIDRVPCVFINAGSGSGKTRLLREVYTHWDDLLREHNAEHSTRPIPSSSVLFPIQFNCKLTPFGPPDGLLYSVGGATALIAVRVLYAYCADPENLHFLDFAQDIVSAIEDNKELSSKAMGLAEVLRSIREEYSDPNLPVFLLIDEVSNVGAERLDSLVHGVNQLLSERFYAVWTSLAVGPFSRVCTRGNNRPAVAYILPALRPYDMKGIIEAEVKPGLERLVDCIRTRGRGDRKDLCILVSYNEALDALASLPGGTPRFLESVLEELNSVLPPFNLTLGSSPFLNAARSAYKSVCRRYSGLENTWNRAFLLSYYVFKLDRYCNISLGAVTESLDSAMSAGGIFDGESNGGSDVVPSVPLLVAMGSKHIPSGKEPFTTYRFEDFIAQWIATFTKARHECLYASNPILQSNREKFETPEHSWRCFTPLFCLSDLSLTKAGMEELKFHGPNSGFAFKQLPRPDEYPHGVYTPKNETHEGIDAIAVLPRGRNEMQTLIALQTKFSVFGRSKASVTDVLIRNYEASMRQLEQSSWVPGENAAFLAFVSGRVDPEDEQRFNAVCPHGRLLHGEGLEAAMGPTVYPYFKHWRTLAAEVVKTRGTNA
jgi:hypothetical protein